MARDSSYQVLSGLLANDVDLIDEVQRTITEQHFTDPTLRSIYRLILTYRSVSQGVLNTAALEQHVASVEAGTAALTREVFEALLAEPLTPDLTRWQVRELRAEREKRMTTTAFREASDILTGSVTEEPDRFGRAGRTWSGPQDAREWVTARVGEIESEIDVADAPAADVLREGRALILDYQRARDEDQSRRPFSGLARLDQLTGGLGRGEVVMVAAPSGYGKTQMCVDMAYFASQFQGLHVYFATSETVRTTVRARLVARHSLNDKFRDMREDIGLPGGLDSQKISRGLLAPEHEQLLGAVALDYGFNGETSSEGSCWVAQMPHGQTIPGLRAQIDVRSRSAMPDLVIVDYLALMSSPERFSSSRESLSSVVKSAAHFAVDFNKGMGVPLISPWQLNRESQREMVRTGEVDQNGLAETAEAVNSADQVWVLTPDGARDGRLGSLKLNVVKNRDGLVLLGDDAILLQVDYATSYFAERAAPSAFDEDSLGMDSGFGADLVGMPS